MNPDLSDIRILKLAQMYERAYEAFVREVATEFVGDDAIKAKLGELSGPLDNHRDRIAAHLDRLNRKMGPVDPHVVERAALRDVLDVERAARAFYLRFVEEIHDPHVARLFRDVAREEAMHVRIVEDALALNDKKLARPHVGPGTERMLRLMDDLD